MSVWHEPIILAELLDPAVWPNLSQAAEIIGVNKSTLSKQANHGHIQFERRGLGQAQRFLSPQEILRIGLSYQRISRATVIERLSTFLSRRSAVDRGIVIKELWRLAETSQFTPTESSVDTGKRKLDVVKTEVGLETAGTEPAWLQAWEQLRSDLSWIDSSMSLTSPDHPIGTLRLGPLVDETERIEMA